MCRNGIWRTIRELKGYTISVSIPTNLETAMPHMITKNMAVHKKDDVQARQLRVLVQLTVTERKTLIQ